MRLNLLAMTGYSNLLREAPRLISETIRPLLFRMLPILKPAVFAALRPPLQNQYVRWTGADREVPEPEVPYIGGYGRPTLALHERPDNRTR